MRVNGAETCLINYLNACGKVTPTGSSSFFRISAEVSARFQS